MEKGFFLKHVGTRGHIYEDLRDTRATEDAGEAIAMENRKEVQSNQLYGSLDNVSTRLLVQFFASSISLLF